MRRTRMLLALCQKNRRLRIHLVTRILIGACADGVGLGVANAHGWRARRHDEVTIGGEAGAGLERGKRALPSQRATRRACAASTESAAVSSQRALQLRGYQRARRARGRCGEFGASAASVRQTCVLHARSSCANSTTSLSGGQRGMKGRRRDTRAAGARGLRRRGGAGKYERAGDSGLVERS